MERRCVTSSLATDHAVASGMGKGEFAGENAPKTLFAREIMDGKLGDNINNPAAWAA